MVMVSDLRVSDLSMDLRFSVLLTKFLRNLRSRSKAHATRYVYTVVEMLTAIFGAWSRRSLKLLVAAMAQQPGAGEEAAPEGFIKRRVVRGMLSHTPHPRQQHSTHQKIAVTSNLRPPRGTPRCGTRHAAWCPHRVVSASCAAQLILATLRRWAR